MEGWRTGALVPGEVLPYRTSGCSNPAGGCRGFPCEKLDCGQSAACELSILRTHRCALIHRPHQPHTTFSQQRPDDILSSKLSGLPSFGICIRFRSGRQNWKLIQSKTIKVIDKIKQEISGGLALDRFDQPSYFASRR